MSVTMTDERVEVAATNELLAEIEGAVANLEPTLEPASDTFKSAVLVLAALRVGADLERLERLTRYGEEFIALRAVRLRAAGTWGDAQVVYEWIRTPWTELGNSFWIDVLVAEGYEVNRRNPTAVMEQIVKMLGREGVGGGDEVRSPQRRKH